MIEIIPSLITPAMLALAPPNHPVPSISYDWHAQRAVMESVEEKLIVNATWKGSQSYVGKGFVIDDFNSD